MFHRQQQSLHYVVAIGLPQRSRSVGCHRCDAPRSSYQDMDTDCCTISCKATTITDSCTCIYYTHIEQFSCWIEEHPKISPPRSPTITNNYTSYKRGQYACGGCALVLIAAPPACNPLAHGSWLCVPAQKASLYQYNCENIQNTKLIILQDTFTKFAKFYVCQERPKLSVPIRIFLPAGDDYIQTVYIYI